MYYRRRNGSDHEDNILNAPLRALDMAMREVDSRKAEAFRRAVAPSRLTIVEHGPMRIILSGAPDSKSLPEYITKLRRYHVHHIVRVCEPTYSAEKLRNYGFQVHDWPFECAHDVPEDVTTKWLELLDRIFHIYDYAKEPHQPAVFASFEIKSTTLAARLSDEKPKKTIAIHCESGLGRSPVLAALALVEMGIDAFEAIGWIRALRRGSITARQMAFVDSFANRPPPQKKRRGRNSSSLASVFSNLKPARFRPRSSEKSGISTVSAQRRTSFSFRRHADH